MATVKVELLRRTPFGKAGDVVEVEESALESYGPDVMEKTKKPLTSDVLEKAEKTAEKSEMNADRAKELDAREKALTDKEQELTLKTTELADKEKALTDKEAELTTREKALTEKEETGKGAEVQTGTVTGAKNTAVKTPEGK